MSHLSQESRLIEVEQRLERLEKQLSKPSLLLKKDNKKKDSFWKLDRYTVDEFLSICGWFIVTVCGLFFITDWYRSSVPNFLVFVFFFIGFWLAIRNSSAVGLSDSAYQLHREARPQRAVRAPQVHLPIMAWWRKGKQKVERDLINKAVITVGLTLFYSWLIFYFVKDPAWQTMAFLVWLLLALSYAINLRRTGLLYLATAAIYALLMFSGAPLFAILSFSLFSLLLGCFAWQKQNWHLFLVIALAAYISIFRWAYYLSIQTVENGLLFEVVLAELLLVLAIFFALPFIYQRRQFFGRETVRAIILTNALGFTFLSSWFTAHLVPSSWLWAYGTALVVSMCFSCLAWMRFGRYSYGKYFAVAFLASLMIGAMLYFDTTTVTVIWLAGAIIAMTAGFTLESYTGRLVGLFALVATFLHYMLSVLPTWSSDAGDSFFDGRVWLGLVLACFLGICSYWFKSLRSRGPEEQNRLLVVDSLLVMSVLVVIGMISLGLIQNLSAN